MSKQKHKDPLKKERAKFRDEFYVRAYELARDGLGLDEIGEVLGVSPSGFRGWLNENEALRKAIKEGRAAKEGRNAKALKGYTEYVYKRLSPEVKAIWDRIVEGEEHGDGGWNPDAVEAALGPFASSKKVRQHLWVHAYLTSNYNVSEACRRMNVPRKTFEVWCVRDPGFRKLFQELKEVKGDFFESALIQKVLEGDSACVLFANKTYNRDRGYNDKVTVEHQHSGSVEMITSDVLDKLPVEVKRKILEEYRRTQLALPEHEEGQGDVIEGEVVG